MQRQTFFGPVPWGPGEGSKGQISFNLITKSISKIFIPNFVCVLTNERYKTYQNGFSFCPLVHAPGVGLWGTGGAQGVKKKFRTGGAQGVKKKIFKHGYVVYQIDGDDKQNRMQVNFSS